MRKKCIVSLLIGLCICTTLFANNEIEKQTYIYSVKGTDTLRLDKYDLPSISTPKPCIIFMFGGGFVGGIRDSEYQVRYFDNLVNKGYTVVSIDYRLGLKNIGKAGQIDPLRFTALLNNSISIAVEDLFDATTFITNHAKDWNINSEMIIANGSSAGAISVLHGEYAICNKEKVAERLPKGFNYAGIISFAGAIFSTDGDLKWSNKPAPIQIFHGDADSNVPYDKLELFRFGFYGSKHISKQLEKIDSPHFFYQVENAAHEIASSPMTSNLKEIQTFLDKLVINKEPLIINTKVKQIGKSEMKKNFELMDYIKTNFGL